VVHTLLQDQRAEGQRLVSGHTIGLGQEGNEGYLGGDGLLGGREGGRGGREVSIYAVLQHKGTEGERLVSSHTNGLGQEGNEGYLGGDGLLGGREGGRGGREMSIYAVLQHKEMEGQRLMSSHAVGLGQEGNQSHLGEDCLG